MKQNSYRMQYRKRGRDKLTLKNKSARAWQQRIKTWRDAQRTKREDHSAWLNLGSTYNIYKPLSCKCQYSQLSTNTCCPLKWYQVKA